VTLILRSHRIALACVVAGGVILGGCGGDADSAGDAASGADVEAPISSAASDDAAPRPDDDSSAAIPTQSGGGAATVNIDGETFYFANIQPSAGEDFYSFCTTLGGSLQAVLQQVDENGERLSAESEFSSDQSGELSVILLEPGGPYEQTGDPAEFAVDLFDGRTLYAVDGGAIDAPAAGAYAAGSAQVTGWNPADGTEVDTSVTFEVGC
jgi:hypothetical protein